MTHQYRKLPVTMKMWMQFNVMPRTTFKVVLNFRVTQLQPKVYRYLHGNHLIHLTDSYEKNVLGHSVLSQSADEISDGA